MMSCAPQKIDSASLKLKRSRKKPRNGWIGDTLDVALRVRLDRQLRELVAVKGGHMEFCFMWGAWF